MPISSAAPAAGKPGSGVSNNAAMAMVTTFLRVGFITCPNDILIPHLKAIFDLNYSEVMLVQFAFFSGYFIFAMTGKLIDWVGKS